MPDRGFRSRLSGKRVNSRVSFIASALLLICNHALANDDGISVEGVATVKAHPTAVLIVGTVSGEGELANDANVKYHDGKKKAVTAIDSLKNPDLSIKSDGSKVQEAVDAAQQQRFMQGMGGGETAKVRVNISERLELTLKNIDKLESDKLLETVLKLIDTGRDAGMVIGPPPATNYYQIQMEAQNGGSSLVQFKVPDITDVQAEAYKQAIADAKAKAQRIADLSGVKLGRVISVHDQGAPAAQPSYNPYVGMMITSGDHNDDKSAVSSTFGEIPVNVHLQVQFEIEK